MGKIKKMGKFEKIMFRVSCIIQVLPFKAGRNSTADLLLTKIYIVFCYENLTKKLQLAVKFGVAEYCRVKILTILFYNLSLICIQQCTEKMNNNKRFRFQSVFKLR